MLILGVDVPLVEVVLALGIVSFILLIEIIIVVVILMQNLKKAKELSGLLGRLSQNLTEAKREELKKAERVKR